MTKTKKDKQKTKTDKSKGASGTKGTQRFKGASMARTPRNSDLHNLMLYRKLLFDPCNAELVEPPYMGLESGYIVRTRDIISPYVTGTSLVSGNYDFFLQWSPGNLSGVSTTTNLGVFTGGCGVGGTFTNVAGAQGHTGSAAIAQQNFINASGTPVFSYRVVACCVTFVPTGPTLSRQGLVSMVTTPSFVIANITTPFGANTIESMCPHVVNVGAERHEIVWIPGSKDQEFGILDASVLEPGYASIAVALSGIDSSANGIGTVVSPNGRFEITTIWQWMPRSQTNGLLQSMEPPSKYNLNDVLSGVKDLGKAVYTGARMYSQATSRLRSAGLLEM